AEQQDAEQNKGQQGGNKNGKYFFLIVVLHVCFRSFPGCCAVSFVPGAAGFHRFQLYPFTPRYASVRSSVPSNTRAPRRSARSTSWSGSASPNVMENTGISLPYVSTALSNTSLL